MSKIDKIKPAKLVSGEDRHWYACYTRSRAEKAALVELQETGIESYLPLVRTRRKWSDRMKWVDMPLLRSYIFVKVSGSDYTKVLSVNSLVRFVTFENRAIAIPDRQIEAIKLLLNQGAELEVASERFSQGEKIVVQAGPFLGLQGELVEYRGKNKVLIRLGKLSESILVTIPVELLVRDYSENNPQPI